MEQERWGFLLPVKPSLPLSVKKGVETGIDCTWLSRASKSRFVHTKVKAVLLTMTDFGVHDIPLG